jgi:hypothetical protein
MHLDGNTYTGITLLCDNEAQLDIGGGPTWYFVTFFKPNEECLTLEGQFHNDDSISPLVIHGNTMYELQKRYHANAQLAWAAVEYFYRLGGADPTLEWHRC